MEYSKCNNCQKDLIAEPWYSFQKKWGLADFGPGQSDMGVKSCQSCLKTVKDRDDLKGLICAVHEPHVYSQYFCQYCRDEKLGTDWDRYYAENHYHICEKRKKALEETPKTERERERERESILAYFKKHNIQSITLNGNNLIIEYNNNSQTETKLIDTSELQLIQSYCQKQGLNTLALFDLQKQEPNTQKPFNWTPWIIGGGIAVVIIIGAIIYFLARKKEPKKDYEDWK